MTDEQEQEIKRLFAQALRVILAKENKSQAWIARQIGVSRPYVSSLYNANKLPSLGTVKKVCDVFGVPVSAFIKGGE